MKGIRIKYTENGEVVMSGLMPKTRASFLFIELLKTIHHDLVVIDNGEEY